MSEEKTFSQDELNSIVQERLERAEKKFEERFSGYMSAEEVGKLKADYDKQISDLNDSMSAQSEKYAEFETQLAERDAKIKAFETNSMKNRIAHEIGLNYEAVGYLQGETEEEIKKSAEGLKSLVGQSFVPPLANPEVDADEDSKVLAAKKMLREMKGE